MTNQKTAQILKFPERQNLAATHRSMHEALLRQGAFARELEEALFQLGGAQDLLLEAAHGHRPAHSVDQALAALKAATFHAICLAGTQASADRALFVALSNDMRRA